MIFQATRKGDNMKIVGTSAPNKIAASTLDAASTHDKAK